MAARSLKSTIVAAADDLLSLHSTPQRSSAALTRLERLVADVALEPTAAALVDAFLASQDSCSCNLTAILLEWLGRSLAFDDTKAAIEPYELLWTNWTRCLRLIQGLLLLHRPSQRLFARRSSFEYLLAVVDKARASLPPPPPNLSAPKPFPSPVLFPPSPLSSPSLAQGASAHEAAPTAAVQLSLAALDVLLSALVDRPANVRVFEDLDGLATLVKVLKDKTVAQPVRIKVIELLYFYLLPESQRSPESPSMLDSSTASVPATSTLDKRVLTNSRALPTLFASAADFIPQTPVRPRTRPSGLATPSASSSSASTPFSPSGRSSASSRESSPTRTPRPLRHKRSQSLTSLRSLAAQPADAAAPPPRERPFARSVAASPRREPPAAPSPRRSFDASASESDSATPRTGRAPRRAERAGAPLAPPPPPPPGDVPPSPRHAHRRSQSFVGLGVGAAPLPAPPRSAARRAERGSSSSEADAEGAMLPPPVPLSSSSRSARPSAGHARARSSVGILERRGSVDGGRCASGGDGARMGGAAGAAGTRSSSGTDSGSGSCGSAATRSSAATSVASAMASSSGRARRTRTEGEKKELLRRVMPNVDALEERFRAMGLGLS